VLEVRTWEAGSMPPACTPIGRWWASATIGIDHAEYLGHTLGVIASESRSPEPRRRRSQRAPGSRRAAPCSSGRQRLRVFLAWWIRLRSR